MRSNVTKVIAQQHLLLKQKLMPNNGERKRLHLHIVVILNQSLLFCWLDKEEKNFCRICKEPE